MPTSPRAIWWLRFSTVFALCALWALGNPLFAGPDEPAHVIKAASVVRGELLPPRIEGTRYQFVSVPQRLDAGNAAASCLAFKPEQDARCIDYHGTDADVLAPTLVGRYPPVIYAVAGLPTLLDTGVAAIYVMRLLFAAVTAVCAASALADLDEMGGALARLGVFAALTPMALFLSGTVNPNAVEIAAAMVLLTSALRLVRDADAGIVATRTVTRCAGAAILLAVCRPLSPLWVAIIGVTVIVGFATPSALRELVRSRLVRVWAAVIVAVSAVQTLWVLIVRPVFGDETSDTDWSTSEAIRRSVGRLSSQLREMIGVFGWLDTPAPELTRLLWYGVVAGLVLTAVVLGTRRQRAAIGVLLAAVVVVPVALEVEQAAELGISWQGRYSLPLAIGVPILAAVVLAGRADPRGDDVRAACRLAATLLVVAHLLAYWQFLRRYTVGANGRLLFFTTDRWEPPVPSLLLLVAYAATVAAFAWCAVVLSPVRARAPRSVPSA